MANTPDTALDARLRELAYEYTRKWEDTPGYFAGHAILDAVLIAARLGAELEREACARLAESTPEPLDQPAGVDIADAICD